MQPKLKKYFERWIKEVEKTLDKELPKKGPFETLYKAMRYSVFAGGKRLRPILVIAAAEACGLKGQKVLPAASAMELIHTYSLIHDDLPAMDDDDLRRGRPTNHKVFGEGNAILAGDALLTFAFQLLSKNAKMLKLDSTSFSNAIDSVSLGAGAEGMVGGQVLDLSMDGGLWLKKSRKEQIRILETIHKSKTAALIISSLLLGANLAQASESVQRHLAIYGEAIGLAFQIADDVLDQVGDKKLLGKHGSDQDNKKLTFVALYGLEESKQRAQALVDLAKKQIRSVEKTPGVLTELAEYIVSRTY